MDYSTPAVITTAEHAPLWTSLETEWKSLAAGETDTQKTKPARRRRSTRTTKSS